MPNVTFRGITVVLLVLRKKDQKLQIVQFPETLPKEKKNKRRTSEAKKVFRDKLNSFFLPLFIIHDVNIRCFRFMRFNFTSQDCPLAF
jgi:hypothetical protein